MTEGFASFHSEAIELCKRFPELMVSFSSDGVPFIEGALQLVDSEGSIVDIYNIVIKPTPNYPNEFPHVFETGGRIPINIDWHVFLDGHCCIKSIPEEILICRKGIDLNVYVNEQVKPYFFNQKYRELHGFYLNERSHGLYGNIEFFMEIFGTKDLSKIVSGLRFIMERCEPNRVHNCFCGSRIKYRKCHKNAYRLLSRFTNEEIELYIAMIVSILK